MPAVGANCGVAVESLLVAQQLVDARDLADALHLDHDRAPVAVAAQQIDRADVGRVLAPHQREVFAQRGDAGRDELLELGLHAVLLEAGVVAELVGRCRATTRGARSAASRPWGCVGDDLLSFSSIVHGGFIQLSGLYAFESEWTAIEPSAFQSTRRTAGREPVAPSRPS